LIRLLGGNKYEISKFVRSKDREKNMRQRKQSHKIIFTQFGNLPMSTKLQEFHYLQEKLQNVAVQFLSLKNHTRKP